MRHDPALSAERIVGILRCFVGCGVELHYRRPGGCRLRDITSGAHVEQEVPQVGSVEFFLVVEDARPLADAHSPVLAHDLVNETLLTFRV